MVSCQLGETRVVDGKLKGKGWTVGVTAGWCVLNGFRGSSSGGRWR